MSFIINHFLVSSIPHLFRKIKIFSKMRNRKLFYRLLLTFTPAAANTIKTFFEDTNTDIADYDMIFTGDLGYVGSKLLYEMLENEGIDIRCRHNDCGLLIYNRNRQDVHSGGSGCGCSASVFNSFLMHRFEEKELNNVLFVSTGALLSPTSSLQGESIPGIAHLVNIKNQDLSRL